MKRIIRCVFAVSFAMILLVGCNNKGVNGAKEKDEYTIGVVAKSVKSEYWLSVRSGMEAAAEEVGAKVMFFAPEAEEDKEAQEKLAMSLIQHNVDALATAPIDALGIPDYLLEAKKKGIPVVTYDSAFDNSDYAYIGIDNRKAGYKMAEYIAKTMNYQGEIGIVSGKLDQMCHKERVEGIQQYIETIPGMKVAYIESGYSGAKMSGEKIVQLRDAYPQVKGLVVTSAVTALGIVESAEAGNMKMVTIDVQEDALYALQNKKLTGLVAQSGFDIGYETVKYIDEVRKGTSEKEEIILDAQFLTSDNVEVFIEKHTK
ncbi:ribose transport system substrate-binding protein [Aequitasia blattaphilus]|uniref:Substrate-binding domain-containing protein n=1 Tax=Aequitasia blattaphilus TaxID=2949332 RepID=A0ABT1E6E3_9FIRM|nr:substrate-binding domain-containing protein [Aequitasia blattaphilus]MCP1101419.1 substrate-binding domain-containing protein [Aequitasia blattaphilus]MCR8614059.1 substrate-binding domain-containing protein [Aequitasia blattaphilus]